MNIGFYLNINGLMHNLGLIFYTSFCHAIKGSKRQDWINLFILHYLIFFSSWWEKKEKNQENPIRNLSTSHSLTPQDFRSGARWNLKVSLCMDYKFSKQYKRHSLQTSASRGWYKTWIDISTGSAWQLVICNFNRQRV